MNDRNRPALPAISYRAGTHPTFLRRMLAALSELGGPATRSTEDPALALLDAWACAADVLTFYSERIANEGYLRTAIERRSVVELARAIGYQPRPAVSAHAFLAVTVDEPAGVAVVPAGTKVSSVPVAGGLPQIFETEQDTPVKAAWNALRPRLTQPQPLDPAATTLYLDGRVIDVRAGGWLLFTGAWGAIAKKATAVTFDAASGRTEVSLDNPPAPAPAFGYVPRQSAVPATARLALTGPNVRAHVMEQDWADPDLTAFLRMQGWAERPVAEHVDTVVHAAPASPAALHAFATRAAAFGHNAPLHATLPDPDKHGTDWDKPPAPITDSRGNPRLAGEFFLDRADADVVPESWLLLEDQAQGVPVTAFRVAAVRETSLAGFALSGRVTAVTASTVEGVTVPDEELARFAVRTTAVHAASRSLALAPLPVTEQLGAGTAEQHQLTLDTLALGLREGQPVVVSGERADLAGVVTSEVARLAHTVHSNGLTTLFFEGEGLRHRYVRSGVTVNANVVEATHGETVHEVLGSGDAGLAGQRFRLRRPLAHLSAPTATGAVSTLRVRVDGLDWQDAPTSHTGDDGTTELVFGDGEFGPRLPTGTENVTATYRSGGGRDGLVPAASLILFQTRPPGVRAVTNPLPASGGAAPEALDSARGNAPIAVRTLDRVVSLDDVADFARAFAGVGKAAVTELVEHGNRVAHLSVAGEEGTVIDRDSPLARTLAAAIRLACDPATAVRVQGHQPLFFDLHARVAVDRRYPAEAVAASARAAVLEEFSFLRRDFGQPVAAAEVLAAIQRVPGVVAADLDRLHPVGSPVNGEPGRAAAVVTVLAAAPARVGPGGVRPAQLLLANPVGITVTGVGEL